MLPPPLPNRTPNTIPNTTGPVEHPRGCQAKPRLGLCARVNEASPKASPPPPFATEGTLPPPPAPAQGHRASP